MDFLEESNLESTKIYDKSIKGVKEFNNKLLGPNTSRIFYEDPKLLLFTLSRYKFVAKQFAGYDSVLEIGCQEGFGAPIVSQEIKRYVGFDFYKPHVDFAKSNLESSDSKYNFYHRDILLNSKAPEQFDCAFALDVLEHISEKHENDFFVNIKKHLFDSQGPLILGMPSLESQTYASERSKLGHINCKKKDNFKLTCKKFYKDVFMFSMNDEVLHTGYSPMSQYLFAICSGPK